MGCPKCAATLRLEKINDTEEQVSLRARVACVLLASGGGGAFAVVVY
jgi:hypothetical protein